MRSWQKWPGHDLGPWPEWWKLRFGGLTRIGFQLHTEGRSSRGRSMMVYVGFWALAHHRRPTPSPGSTDRPTVKWADERVCAEIWGDVELLRSQWPKCHMAHFWGKLQNGKLLARRWQSLVAKVHPDFDVDQWEIIQLRQGWTIATLMCLPLGVPELHKPDYMKRIQVAKPAAWSWCWPLKWTALCQLSVAVLVVSCIRFPYLVGPAFKLVQVDRSCGELDLWVILLSYLCTTSSKVVAKNSAIAACARGFAWPAALQLPGP